jgi:hypothetical protein
LPPALSLPLPAFGDAEELAQEIGLPREVGEAGADSFRGRNRFDG